VIRVATAAVAGVGHAYAEHTAPGELALHQYVEAPDGMLPRGERAPGTRLALVPTRNAHGYQGTRAPEAAMPHTPQHALATR